MTLFLKFRVLFVTSVCSSTLFCVTCAHAVMDPRFVLDPKIFADSKSTAKTKQADGKHITRTQVGQSSSTPAKERVYTVKPGDHLLRILIRDFGLSKNEAVSFIDEIKHENNIRDIKRLKIGQKIIIPNVLHRSDRALNLLQAVKSKNIGNDGPHFFPEQSFKLESPVAALLEQEEVTRLHDVWNRIIPSKKDQLKPLALQTSTFSLTLDPERYPTFARMGGGRIVLDQNGRIPPLVKSLIEDKDASVRIVTESPSGSKPILNSLLEAAGFYSVEENFSMEFGVDPKLTVQADYKIEKTAESLIKQDVVLVNSGRTPLPPALGVFLNKEGFSLYEPFASLKSVVQRDSRSIYYISAKKQPEMVDSILSALSVSPERDRRVNVFAADNNGISLTVKAQRYFERGGRSYVVTSFDGDPISYTLFRILETKGYKVIILEDQDDFRKISEKIISRMNIKGGFAQHNMPLDKSAGYSLQMSGFMLDDASLPDGEIFLTDRAMDRIVRDLFTANGYKINGR